MCTGNRYSKEIKSEVLKKIREGQRVSDVASEYGRRFVRSSFVIWAQVRQRRLRCRENRDLTELIGRLTVKSDRLEKNSAVETTEPSNKSRKLGVSRSSFSYRAKKPDKDESLRRQIEEVMLKNPGYGYPRVALALNINE